MQTRTFFRQSWLARPVWGHIVALLFLAGLFSSYEANAQTFFDDAITLTQQPTGSTVQSASYAGKRTDAPYNSYPRLGNANSTPAVATPNIGTYDLNGTSQLTLNTASLIISAATRAASYNSVQLLYRVYLAGTTPVPSFTQSAPLTQTGTDSYGDPIYQNTTDFAINLLSGLTSGGTYNVEVRFQIALSDGTTQADPDGAYSLAFNVTPPPVTPAGGTTTWQGASRGPNGSTLTSDTDWTNTANWTNGVPNATSNAIIPAKTNSTIVYPFLNDPTYNYAVNNLTLQGNSGSTAAQLVINIATLSIFGNLTQPGGGLAGNITNVNGATNSMQNSTIIFAGGNQIITGQLLVSDIIIAGSGVKSVINTLIPSNIIAFRPTSVTNGVVVQSAAQDLSSGTVTTVFDTTGNSYISLVSSSIISLLPGEAETNTSYIKGVTRADRSLTAGIQNKFGNIGLDLTANHTPGNLFVYRVLGDPLSGPVSSTAVPIKRYFKIIGDDDSRSTVTAGSTIDIIIHYLNSVDELNGIAENNLAMFRSEVNGAPYTALGGTLNTVNETVTRPGVPSLSTSFLTLGDKTNPLPVSLTAFTATRSNQNVLLTWTTATEQNNAGFEVQVSTNGTAFRKLAFLASKGPNSTQALTYSYTDNEAGKTGNLYYRLRQLDVTGEETFSPVRVVSFDGAATAVALSAYPNPFADKVAFNLDATTLGTNGVAHVQLLDMAGRIVREQNLAVQDASLALDNLTALRSGLYMARITLPDGSTKTLRIQKQ